MGIGCTEINTPKSKVQNGGKGDMQARNRTVVNFPHEKIEKRCFEWMVFLTV
jgi:hypothetical protein